MLAPLPNIPTLRGLADGHHVVLGVLTLDQARTRQGQPAPDRGAHDDLEAVVHFKRNDTGGVVQLVLALFREKRGLLGILVHCGTPFGCPLGHMIGVYISTPSFTPL